AGNAGRQREPRAMPALLGRGSAREEDRHHRTEEIGDGGLPRREHRPEGGGGEARLKYGGRPTDEGLEEGVERIRVEKRQGRAEDISGIDLQEIGGIEAPPEELCMRAAHALRRPGGPRRIE